MKWFKYGSSSVLEINRATEEGVGRGVHSCAVSPAVHMHIDLEDTEKREGSRHGFGKPLDVRPIIASEIKRPEPLSMGGKQRHGFSTSKAGEVDIQCGSFRSLEKSFQRFPEPAAPFRQVHP